MLDPLDRHSRDSTLFQFTTKRMRDFIDPKHLLIQIDEQFDFQKLVEPLEAYYCRDNGRPAIHPEVLVRALLISSLYNVQFIPTAVCCDLRESGLPLVLLPDDRRRGVQSFHNQLLHRARGQRGFWRDIPAVQRGAAATGTSVAADVRRLQPGKGERQWSQLISEWDERGGIQGEGRGRKWSVRAA